MHRVSAATTEGLRDLAFTMAAVIARPARPRRRRADPAGDPARSRWRVPTSRWWRRARTASGSSATSRAGGSCRPTSANDEAVGYLADRLAKLGIEQALGEAGAQAGAEVLIGEEDNAVVFDWDPDVPAAGAALGPRGTDSSGSADSTAATGQRAGYRPRRK